ncbi:hypothetical protein SSZBM1_11 [Synechococcus phage S-SZBM1]|uniref:Uncharacterized protein n=1 Tax=Synechococcus phage S-SZBM1 TaxID=2926475 RepID=A0AC61TSC3_9CAUD|nr:hypothetical protein PP650_gp011 [Synechococcus phage S-SZBM1]UNH61128.1 hypothetical protein SSZBM1_11 [Synechococcus phage S-SZBM1]
MYNIERTQVANTFPHTEYVWVYDDEENWGENRLCLFIIDQDPRIDESYRVKMRKKVREDEFGPVYHYEYKFSADDIPQAKTLIEEFIN